MSRPEVSVVMPFAGEHAEAEAAIATLLALARAPGDELILSDNSGSAPCADGLTVVRAERERSPAHARNVGAERAHGEWILFLDADCRAPSGLLDAYFAQPARDDVGALVGEVIAAPGSDALAARYGAARNFLGQRAHLEHPFRPRAAAANLLVRRAAFEQLGGFYEGLRAAEDTDFSWRLQQAGWRLELRPDACVEHRYRTSVAELRRQWRGYAAGRAWLARRYDGFRPEPAVRRALLRGLARGSRGRASAQPQRVSGRERGDRARFLMLDALLSAEELAGLALSNHAARRSEVKAGVVLVADRFPARDDPLVEFARALDGARVEAVARPGPVDVHIARAVAVDYREDDGAAARLLALLALVLRHPLRCALEVSRRAGDAPPLHAIAPAARRLERDRDARVLALGGGGAHATAARLARLAGRRLEEARHR